MTLGSLFVASFLSSTLLPGSSEALLLYLLSEDQADIVMLWLTATAGNTLGSLLTMLMGLMVALRWPLRKYEKDNDRRAIRWMKTYGYPVLLLAWLPVIGDPLCFFAGWLRLKWLPAISLILLGKALRYAFLIFLAVNLGPN